MIIQGAGGDSPGGTRPRTGFSVGTPLIVRSRLSLHPTSAGHSGHQLLPLPREMAALVTAQSPTVRANLGLEKCASEAVDSKAMGSVAAVVGGSLLMGGLAVRDVSLLSVRHALCCVSYDRCRSAGLWAMMGVGGWELTTVVACPVRVRHSSYGSCCLRDIRLGRVCGGGDF